jgi:hypothetical protein
MRWLGLFLFFVGIGMFLVSFTFDSSFKEGATLVQVVEGENLIGKPVRLKFETTPVFVKGTGPEGSKFIEKAVLQKTAFVPIEIYRTFTAMGKIASLVMIAIGFAGFIFESWCRRTGRILTGVSPD